MELALIGTLWLLATKWFPGACFVDFEFQLMAVWFPFCQACPVPSLHSSKPCVLSGGAAQAYLD